MTYLWNMPRDKHGRPGPGGRGDAKRRKSKARKGATIIHVAFGSGGGRLDAAPRDASKHDQVETRAAAGDLRTDGRQSSASQRPGVGDRE